MGTHLNTYRALPSWMEFCSMTFPLPRFPRLALALIASLALPAVSLAAAPRVIGFERAHRNDGDAVAAGNLLLGELNCTSCHAADASLATHVQKKPAPVLDTVGSRVRPEYLLKFLADPQATKPGTTMPNVLAGVPESERAAKVEALVHFLASTGNIIDTAPLRQAVGRGDVLYHSVGCVGCHDPRKGEDSPALATSIPLGTPSRKYTLAGLTQFLENPLAVRPGGRMPHLLAGTDARDVASFLLNDMDLASGLQYTLYEGSFESVNDLAKATPKKVGETDSFDIDVAKRKDHFGLRFDGTIQIPNEGEYMFVLGSDDGSRLTIDGKVVVVNDGVHPPSQKRGKIKLKPGLANITVEYFENAGGEELQVLVEGPGVPLQSVDKLIAIRAPQQTKPTQPEFKVDPSKAAQGRELFASLGCASCHSLKIDNQPVASTFKAPALTSLKDSGGCLSEAAGKTPFYGLDAQQRTSLAAAIAAAKQPVKPLDDSQFISATLVRFNCIACHQRGELGGIEDARNPHFLSDMPEMGDEGRIPPHLNGVGAKLQESWLKTVFAEGAKDRPYMLTRMPRFGLENLGNLVTAFVKADAGTVKPAPNVGIPDDDKRFKATGRRLVGSQAFGCIKCHTFADKQATGIQALSMTTMHKRLRPEWFHAYLINPQAYRPGTRMPAAWPNGESQLPNVLDGDTAKQIQSIWAYLSDGDKATLPVGLVTGKMELMAFDEAIIYRNFIEGAGPRAIGVGYPEKLNLAWDANDLRLALIWHGSFIDANRHWSGRGVGFEPPLGDKVLKLAEGATVAKLADANAPWPAQSPKELGYKFRGYRLGHKRQPTFLYDIGGTLVEDYLTPYGDADLYVFRRTLTLKSDKPAENLWYRAAVGNTIEPTDDGAFVVDGQLTLHLSSAEKSIVRDQSGRKELLVPLKFENGQAQVVQDYEW